MKIHDKTIDVILDNIDVTASTSPEKYRHFQSKIESLNKDVFNKMCSRSMVGVQPISDVTGFVHYMRCRFDRNTGPNKQLSLQILKSPVVENRDEMELPSLSDFLGSDEYSDKLAKSIDEKVFNTISDLVPTPAAMYDQSKASGTATYVGDEHAALATMISQQSNVINARTRRGGGNVIRVSPRALAILVSATNSSFEKMVPTDKFGNELAPGFCGILNGIIDVYVDGDLKDDTVLIGYRGPVDTDAGVFYLPRYLLPGDDASGNFSLFHHHALTVLESESETLGHGADYFSKVGIVSDTLSFY